MSIKHPYEVKQAMSKPPPMCKSITKQPRAHPYTIHPTSHEAPPKHDANTFKVTLKASMTEKYNYIIKNKVWEIVPRPIKNPVIDSQWLYKIKHVADGSINKPEDQICSERVLSKRGSQL
jgi:hypothetical protein